MVAGTHKIHLKTGTGHPADTGFEGQISINIQVIGCVGGAHSWGAATHPRPGHVPAICIGYVNGDGLVGAGK